MIKIIDPSRKRPLFDFDEFWAYREVIYFLVWRDFKVKYRQTYLGLLWAVLHPMIAMSVFSVFFGKLVGIPSNGVPYPLLVLCGLVPWNFFSRGISSMTGSLVSNQELVRRVYFPRVAIPLASMLACVTDMILGFVVILLALAAFATAPAPQILLLPLPVLIMMTAVLGLGLALSAWNIRFRDVGYIVPFTMQILLFASPIIYPSSLVPDAWRPLYGVNPIAGVIEAVRWCILGTPADWLMIAISIVCSLVLLGFGVVVFSKAEKAFPDLI